ncbi:MAG: hypothetical protein K6C08_01675 [Oscillospiraceae bacterium]|nr:hypothetical protein [Oscillospiraceae bacterium]
MTAANPYWEPANEGNSSVPAGPEYDEDGNIITAKKYNDKGRLLHIELKSVADDGTVIKTEVHDYTYSGDGDLLSDSYVLNYPNDIFSLTEAGTKNIKDGVVISSTYQYLLSDGSLLGSGECTYENGEITSDTYTYYDENGNASGGSSTIYEYSPDGNFRTVTGYIDGEQVYQFYDKKDENGNWIPTDSPETL